MKVVTRSKNTIVQFRFWEDKSSNTKTITYSDFNLELFKRTIAYFEKRFGTTTEPQNTTKIGVSINGGPISIRFKIWKRFKFEQIRKELLRFKFISAKTFQEELEDLIRVSLPNQICLAGGVTYRQTLETPEERAEVFLNLDVDDVMGQLAEAISAISDVVEELNSNEGDIVDRMQDSLDMGDYDD